MRAIRLCLLSLLLFPLAGHPATAQDSVFLQSLAGSWNGKGMVITRIGAPAINVNCRLSSAAGATSIAMKGTCYGLLVVRRAISAELSERRGRYSGVYVGPSGFPSSLSGNRNGNSINLSVRWSRVVNGDRTARMMIQKVGANGLRLRTIDEDPATGKAVATSDILLKRR